MAKRISAPEAARRFQQESQALWEQVDRWLEAHPEATLKEMEQFVRPLRRRLMGQMVALQLLKRGAGVVLEPLVCPHCGEELEYKGIRDKPVVGVEFEGELPRAYYYCPRCRAGFSPLDHFLKLGKAPWSEWLREEGCRLVSESPSYVHAEDKLARLTGAALSDTTLWRAFDEVGATALQVLEDEETTSAAPLTHEEAPGAERVAAADSLAGERACSSVDGTHVLTREQGWKEVKGTTISLIADQPKPRRPAEHPGRSPRPANEPAIHLTQHSYRMRMTEAERFGVIHGAEADRRRLAQARDMASVNDGAPWCWRLTTDNCPGAVQILDWDHALTHVNAVAQAAFGEGSARAQTWYQEAETLLWQDQVETLLQRHWRQLPRRAGERGATIRKGRAYMQEHQARMRYQWFRKQGYPIGSGSMESACRNVVQWRMKRGGARWSTARVNPMLAVLGETNSGRWAEMWTRVEVVRHP